MSKKPNSNNNNISYFELPSEEKEKIQQKENETEALDKSNNKDGSVQEEKILVKLISKTKEIEAEKKNKIEETNKNKENQKSNENIKKEKINKKEDNSDENINNILDLDNNNNNSKNSDKEKSKANNNNHNQNGFDALNSSNIINR